MIKTIISLLSVFILVLAAACGGSSSDSDASSSGDTNTTYVGPPGTATVTLTGARNATIQFDKPKGDSVLCLSTTTALDLSLEVGGIGSDGDTLRLKLADYSGPGTYEFTYKSGVSNSLSVSSGEFSYVSRVYSSKKDSSELATTCTITTSYNDSEKTLSGNVSCKNLFAHNQSKDYLQSPVDFQPRVDLTMSFSCFDT